MDVGQWLSMGGYAGFVWPAYGLCFVVLAAVLAASIRSARRNNRLLEASQAARASRRGCPPSPKDGQPPPATG